MQYSLTTAEAWDVMVTACEQAQRSIDIEQYILRDDGAGYPFLALLAKRAREGVKVRLILDGYGSHAIQRHPVVAMLRQEGAEIHFYRPFTWTRWLLPFLWLPRTHAKLLLIDGIKGYLGSMNMSVDMRGWRDTQIGFEGRLAVAAQTDFHQFWREQRTSSPKAPLEKTISGSAVASYAAQNPEKKDFPIYNELLEEIERAKSYIQLATPYFFPPRPLRKALTRASARGVKVTLLLSNRTDVRLADIVTGAMLHRWRRAGLNVLFYQPTVLHAKYAVIDGSWGTVGSCNFDYLSLRCNRESNLILRGAEDVAELARQFHDDRSQGLPENPCGRDHGNKFSKRLVGYIGAALMRLI